MGTAPAYFWSFYYTDSITDRFCCDLTVSQQAGFSASWEWENKDKSTKMTVFTKGNTMNYIQRTGSSKWKILRKCKLAPIDSILTINIPTPTLPHAYTDTLITNRCTPEMYSLGKNCRYWQRSLFHTSCHSSKQWRRPIYENFPTKSKCVTTCK